MGKYFGTDGVRGVANIKLTADLAFKIGRFIGQFPIGHKNKIVIGRDTRLSGDMLDAALIAGITSSGGDVYEMGITTTPSISYTVERNNFDFGIMISASHNPYYDNGIKIFAPNGEKLSSEIEDLIEEYIDGTVDSLQLHSHENIGRVFSAKEYVEKYLDYLCSKSNGTFKNLKVCFDCSNGSASKVAQTLFIEKLGLENADIINFNYNGININAQCGSTHMEQLCETVKQGGYDLGIAFDGDADRFLLVNELGEIVDGDAIMYMHAIDLKSKNLLTDNKIVLTVMSNIGLKKALTNENIGYLEVGVGDKYVQACLKEKHLVLGGEQSGHFIFFNDLNTGDGLLSAIKTLNLIGEKQQKLSEITAKLHIFPQFLRNIVVINKDVLMQKEALIDVIKEVEKELAGDGRILVRPSGTEQLIRVMVEAPTMELCKKYVNKVADVIVNLSYK